MLECNAQSKLIRKRIESKQEDSKHAACLGIPALTANSVLCDRGVKEMIRIIDSKEIVKEMYKETFKQHHKLIDIEARC